MRKEHHTRLTAPEIANLWTQYMNDSIAISTSKYFLVHIQDEDIHTIFKTAFELSTRHIDRIKDFFSEENFPIMTLHGLTGYAVALSTSSRSDMQKYYIDCTKETMDFYYQIMNLMKSKVFIQDHHISPPEIAGFVEKQFFLTGWFGERRPLNAIEISNITFNMNKLNLSKALGLGFSQVTNTEEVRKHYT
jgi:spore coat protein CotF